MDQVSAAYAGHNRASLTFGLLSQVLNIMDFTAAALRNIVTYSLFSGLGSVSRGTARWSAARGV